MIKQYKVMINNIDVTSKITSISYSMRDYQLLDSNNIDKRIEFVISFSSEPLEDIFNISDFDIYLEINGRKIDDKQFFKELIITNTYVQLILRKR